MLAIELRFSAGRYLTPAWGRSADDNVPEWPPSPWRLLRALVAVWKRTCPCLSQSSVRAVLRTLADPPHFALPSATLVHSRHYLPWEKKGPADHTLVLDSFVVVHPHAPLVLRWPGANLPPGQVNVLADLLARLTFLGRAESWCQARLLPPDEARATGPFGCVPLDRTADAPGDDEVVRVLCADGVTAFERPPRLSGRSGSRHGPAQAGPPPYDPDWQLCLETADLHRERWSAVPGGRWVAYRRPANCFALDRPADLVPACDPAQPGRQRLTLARYALDAAVLPPVSATLPLAEQVRRALLCRYNLVRQEAVYGKAVPPDARRFLSQVFAGKDEHGQPSQTYDHAYYLPADEDGDGRLDHVTVVAAAGFKPDEVRALDGLRSLRFGEGPPLRLLLAGLGNRADFRSPLFGPATVWESATPFLVTRHLKLRGRKRDDAAWRAPARRWEFVRQVLLEQLERQRVAGLALPAVAGVEPLAEQRLEAVVRVRPAEFERFRRKTSDDGGRRPYGLFRITFAEVVDGPLCLGHSSHFGLGQFHGWPGH